MEALPTARNFSGLTFQKYSFNLLSGFVVVVVVVLLFCCCCCCFFVFLGGARFPSNMKPRMVCVENSDLNQTYSLMNLTGKMSDAVIHDTCDKRVAYGEFKLRNISDYFVKKISIDSKLDQL